MASDRRHGASLFDNAAGRPTLCAVRSSSVAPAWATTLDPPPSTVSAGYGPVVFFARKVLPFLQRSRPRQS